MIRSRSIVDAVACLSPASMKMMSKQVRIQRNMSAFATLDEYQFLQRSKLSTLHFQKSLPRLPIPLLEKTCERYLTALQPLLSSEELEKTQHSVQEFQRGVGMELHALLKKSDDANKHTSYISEPWFDMYLSDRTPLPLNYNPLLVMQGDPRSQYQNQLLRATNLVISSLRFWRSLQSNLLEPEVYHMNAAKSDTAQFRQWTGLAPSAVATYVAYAYKAFPLDMSQYERLFGVSRIPQLGKDRLVQNSNARHILVLKRGNMYAVDVLDEYGQIPAPSVLLGRLQFVLQLDAEREASQTPLGVLTTGERDTWANTRDHLVNGISRNNKALLEDEVDAALFCLCLDSEEDAVYEESNPVPLLKNFLAGAGKNRWFDKSVSLLVSVDGTAAVNFEHSWGDGVAVLRYFNEIYKDTLENSFVHPSTEAELHRAGDFVRKIEFEKDDKLSSNINEAIATNSAIVDNLDMQLLRYPEINKEYCKTKRISPDSIMQLSFQLAYRQAFHGYVGTYESCSTAAFRHGRTETMRPCTMATKEFCESIIGTNTTKRNSNELREMISQCSSLHGQLTKEAAMGQGFDRHLFGLKHMALKNNLALPDLYASEPYCKLNKNIISTSTLTSDALLAGAFGPVVRDGLGVGYSIGPNECGAIVTSYKNGGRDGKLFIDSLEQAFKDIHTVINTN